MNIDYKNSVVKYTVLCVGGRKGTITVINEDKPRIASLQRNIQFVDNFNNKMGFDGYLQEILNEEVIG